MVTVEELIECGVWDAPKIFEKLFAVDILFGLLANAFVLFVMLKTRKIRKNSANNLIFATLGVNCVNQIWFLSTTYQEARSKESFVKLKFHPNHLLF